MGICAFKHAFIHSFIAVRKLCRCVDMVGEDCNTKVIPNNHVQQTLSFKTGKTFYKQHTWL